jgi:hypothetical protein
MKSIRMRYMRYVESRGAYRVLVGKPEKKRPLGTRGCRHENDIKIDLQEITMEVNCIALSEDMESGGLL